MSKIYGAITHGYECLLINVEISLNNGLPTTTIVGLANKAVDESKERVRAAFAATGLTYPKKKIIINLAPADVPKQDSGLDLALAVCILGSSPTQLVEHDTLFIGELGLDGSVRRAAGIIGKLLAAKANGIKTAYIPEANKLEASLVSGIDCYAVSSLPGLIAVLQSDEEPLKPLPIGEEDTAMISLDDVQGHFEAKRALLIAIAGGHNIHFYGPPGSGKTMLAKASRDILPKLSEDDALAVAHLQSLTVNGNAQPSLTPPFRTPHHTASSVSIIGGGADARPGEISLAHRGVLMLDELPEYDRKTLETLRQPLEDKQIIVSRAKLTTVYPADFLLIATSNPCPCGFLGSEKPCSCSAMDIARYTKKLSGPIIDRIDMHTYVSSVQPASILEESDQKPVSSSYRKLVILARSSQKRRNPDGRQNGMLSAKELRKSGGLSVEAKNLLDSAVETLGLSNRGYLKTVRVARTIADLDDKNGISRAHMAEALQYRKREITTF